MLENNHFHWREKVKRWYEAWAADGEGAKPKGGCGVYSIMH